ncbi:MAG: helix-turn-helix transcriptional regulator [Chitinophagaceae bacterium]|nr:helix-turn-helix transcriptional regulator [Chitinophagaceae bacterium]
MNTTFFASNNTAIRQLVNAAWQVEGTPSYRHETILPKGVIELVFSFSKEPAFSHSFTDQKINTPRCFINGMNNMPLYLKTPAHQFFFGVELNPLAVKKLLAVSPGVFLNSVTDLTLISNDFDGLWHQLAEAGSFQQRVTIIHQWAGKKQSTFSEQELAFSSYLHDTSPAGAVTGLASRFCYSIRQLSRKSNDLFGMSTESLISYKRYLHSVRWLHHSNESLTSVGYECGFYDQAHFIREFRDYTGITPGDYRRQKSDMPAHLFG